ncbi:SurA N-terminal domain-containing protein [Brevibacillus choshinensis]|uniref:Peptidyl-prolyl cis-trans isomerase n=1 Tax=Brevibacillus choshinensis TaxID=54911 RepID=A0ABX7FU12_BRECH|nr:SurA N-terminal domain-containing protein [Brevibacillus choshinensis]QRG69662.1 peptidyl-prolyl cis-trans isomerase [Brevibacillus choshinensis]
MKKFDVSVLTVSVLILGLAVIGVSQAKETTSEAVAAKIGNTTITQTQVYDELKKKSGASAMTQLVAAELFRQEAKAQGVTVSDQELDKLINPIKEKLGTPEKFQEYLDEKKTTEQEFREKTRLIMMRDKLLEKAFPVTDEQIKAYYEKNKDKYAKQTLEQARPEIAEKVKDKNRRANIDKWLEDLHKKYHVEIMDPTLQEKEKDKKE